MNASRRFAILCAAFALWPSTLGAQETPRTLPNDVFAPALRDDTVDVMLFNSNRATIVRIHVRVGERPFHAVWRDFIVRLHHYLDRNDDGVLTINEANLAPWTSVLNNPLNGVRPLNVGGPLDTTPRDGQVSVEELTSYLRANRVFEPVAAEPGAPSDPRTEALFGQLDRDGDKVLSPAELAGTDTLLTRLDRDEDETLSLDELVPDRSPLADRFRAVNRGVPFDPRQSPAVPLSSAGARPAIATRLLRSSHATIAPESIGASSVDIYGADADHDGRLNRDELVRYLEWPTPQLELTVAFPVARGSAVGLARAPGGSLTARYGPDGTVIIDFAGIEIEFSANDRPNNSLRLIFENQFKVADANKDGAISEQEARGNVVFQQIHAVADRDTDGKLTGAEFKTYTELNSAADEARTLLTVSDEGTSLYERLDGNRDGRLTVRELRRAPAGLSGCDADRDGRIALAELPRRLHVNIGRGVTLNRNRVAVAAAASRTVLQSTSNRTGGPAWFAAMDRNRDGDVSEREFLGTADQFRQFDADADGLISASEAARAR